MFTHRPGTGPGMLQITIHNWCIFPAVIDITNGALEFLKFSHNYHIDRERFAGLNIHGFNAIEVFVKIFLHCLGHKYSNVECRLLTMETQLAKLTSNISALTSMKLHGNWKKGKLLFKVKPTHLPL